MKGEIALKIKHYYHYISKKCKDNIIEHKLPEII